MTAPVAKAVARKAATKAGASAARAGAGKAAARSARGGALPPKGTAARRQRDAIDAIKADREPEPEPAAEPATTSTRSSTSSSGLPSALTDRRGAAAWTRPDPVRAANSGAGFVLGLGLYAAGLIYLREGAPGVKRWLAAKFLNRVETP